MVSINGTGMFVRWSAIGVVLLGAITPLGNEATHPVVLGIYRTLLLSIIAGYLLWADRSQLRPVSAYFSMGVAAAALLMVLSILRSPGSHVEGFYYFFQNGLFGAALLALAHTSSARPDRWKRGVLAAVVGVNVVYVIGAMVAPGRPLAGPFVNANYFASYLLPGLAVCAAAVYFESSPVIRAAAGVAGLFLYGAILQTTSRGAALAGLAMLAIALFRAVQRKVPGWRRIAALGAVVVIIGVGASPALVRKFLDRGQRDPYNYKRGPIWLSTLRMIGENPLTGVGLAGYQYNSKRFTPPVEGTISRYRRWPNIAHSQYLQYAAEIGIPGAVLMFTLAGWVLYVTMKRAKQAEADQTIFHEAALLAAAGLGFHALVDNNWTVPVLASGLAVVSQADLLPYAQALRRREVSRVVRLAFGFGLVLVWVQGAMVPAVGLYFNDQGHRAYAAHDFTRSERMHRLALAVLPTHPVLIDNLGLVYFDEFMRSRDSRYLDRAEHLFERAIEENPRFDAPAAHLESALIQRLTGNVLRDRPIQMRIAEADRHVLETSPFNPFVRKNLAEALYNSGRRDEAYQELLTAVGLEPNYVPGYMRLAEWYGLEGRVSESEEYKRRAVQVIASYRDTSTSDPFEDLLLGRPRRSGGQPPRMVPPTGITNRD